MGCRTYDGFLQVFCGFNAGFVGFACGLSQPPPPCPPSHHVKPGLLIDSNVQKLMLLLTGMFFGLEGPVLSSLTENGQECPF